MADIFDYVASGKKPLKLSNFTVADAMVFSQLSYLDFSSFKNKTKLSRMKDQVDKMVEQSRLPKQNKRLFELVASSPRYKNIKMSHFIQDTDVSIKKQFSAISFLIGFRFMFVAFRGTDGTMVGWEEDFNLAFMDEIPAQAHAKEYLWRVMRRYFLTKVVIGGHSKGGNLAIFAGMNMVNSYQKRLLSAFNFDGPSFKTSIVDSDTYQRFLPKVRKIVPESSVIGMLLEDSQHFKIIESSAVLLAQHDLYTWKVHRFTGELTYLPELSKPAVNMHQTLIKWLKNLNDEDRKIIVESFFNILYSTEATSFSDFTEHWPQKVAHIYQKYRQLDKTIRPLLLQAFAVLGKCLSINFFTRERKEKKPHKGD